MSLSASLIPSFDCLEAGLDTLLNLYFYALVVALYRFVIQAIVISGFSHGMNATLHRTAHILQIVSKSILNNLPCCDNKSVLL